MPEVDSKTWEGWRQKLGASKQQAREFRRQFEGWAKRAYMEGDLETKQVRVLLRTGSAAEFEIEYQRFIDRMPRKAYAFLAWYAELERKRAAIHAVEDRKTANRVRFCRRYARELIRRLSQKPVRRHVIGNPKWMPREAPINTVSSREARIFREMAYYIQPGLTRYQMAQRVKSQRRRAKSMRTNKVGGEANAS